MPDDIVAAGDGPYALSDECDLAHAQGIQKRFYSRGRRGALRRDRPEVTSAVRDVAAALVRHADAYYREFESGPLTPAHGDSHLGNTFAWPAGCAGLLDWQVIWQGPGAARG